MKLTQPQRTALERLAGGSWTAAWWGGRPHSRWPQWMNARTYGRLSQAGLITTDRAGRVGPFDRTVRITVAGVAALRGVPLKENSC
jgi:hypothetical protein